MAELQVPRDPTVNGEITTAAGEATTVTVHETAAADGGALETI